MRFVRPPNLTAQFLEDGRLLLKDTALGIGAKVPPWTISLISLCSTPHLRAEVVAKMSHQGGQLFDQLVDIGILIPEASEMPEQMFQNFASIPVHRRMLGDEQRLRIYKQALDAAVGPESVVIDAGSGSGVLAVLAALAGAKRVYAVERSNMADVIQRVAKDSGVGDRIIVKRGNFASVQIEEPADILITETFGAWGLAEGAARDLKACVENNLAPDGVFLPHTVNLWAAPLKKCPSVLLDPFQKRPDGVNLSSLRADATLRSENLRFESAAKPQKVCTLSLLENQFHSELILEEDCGALLLWFDLCFQDGITLSTSPQAPQTHWKQTVIAASLSAGKYTLRGSPAADDPRTFSLELNGLAYRIR